MKFNCLNYTKKRRSRVYKKKELGVDTNYFDCYTEVQERVKLKRTIVKMPVLGDFALIRNNLSTATRTTVAMLHQFVFESEGDRGNRKRLRSFEGFSFGEDDEEQYNKKAEYVTTHMKTSDLVSICCLLGIDYDVEDVFQHIFVNLKKGMLLTAAAVAESEDDDTENEENETDDEQNMPSDDENDQTIVNVRKNEVIEVLQDNDEENDDEQEHHNEVNVCAQRCAIKNENSSTKRNNTYENNDLFVKSKKRLNDQNKGDNNNSRNQPSCGLQCDVVNVNAPRFSMNFRDIEDSMRVFDGSGTLSIKSWLEEFEEMASVMYWDDFHKFVFAKKSLTGLAKLFVSSERGITTWIKLKKALLCEFGSSMNSAQLHKLLTERKIGKDESVHEYFLNMKELASRGSIEDSALIEYVIDGIKDSISNKTILYGARNLTEFKEKLKCYEVMWLKYRNNNETKHSAGKSNVKSDKNILCYNCGNKGHSSKSCRDKEKGLKCFNCEKFGHISRDCPLKTEKGIEKSNVRLISDDIMRKNVKFGELELLALFDTGSKFNIVSETIFNRLGKPRLLKSNFYLVGFGINANANKVKPLGNFNFDIQIDNEQYDLTFHVVPNSSIDVEVILGKEFCRFAEISITSDGLKINKVSDSISEETHSIMKMDVCTDDECNIDINPTASEASTLKVKNMIQNYEPQKIKTTNVEMRITLTDDTPIFCTPRRLPLKERMIVDEQIDEWLEEGIIEPSESEFCSPIVLVKKKDSTYRLCVDYRKINKVIVKDHFPLPLIEDQLDRLQGAMIFSTIDLRNGFFHVNVNSDSRKFTSFITHNGQFQFLKVPFGLTNSPAVFQRHVNSIFRNLTREGIALPYVDDVIVPAKTEDEALTNLERVLETCKDYGLDINIKKCHFLNRRIQFLGNIIENQQISPTPEKIKAMAKYPQPKDTKQVERFLGLAGYFRKFIPGFALIAKPLTDLKKKDTPFRFDVEQISAFNRLKQILCDVPVLRIFDQNYETEVHTDASIDGYGAVLLQKSPEDNFLHPVYYMSKKTSNDERKYTSYELEALAIIQALTKFRVYLIGMHFKIVTDCNAFAKTLDKKGLCTRVARWVLFLQEYDYVIEHRPGTQMGHVDAFSRHPIMTINEHNLTSKISRLQIQDEDLNTIRENLKDKSDYKDYFMKGDILYKLVDDCELIVLPKGMRSEIIRNAHERGHFSIKKTKELISKEYFIPNLEERIQKQISNCIPCIITNRKRGKQEGELNPIPKDDTPLRTYHIDFLGPLQSTCKLYNHIFAVIDSFTKFCWLYPTKTTSAKDAISRLTTQSTIFGNPARIISDRGSAFTSDEFRIYCEEENIDHIKITTGLPRANGQIERLNSVIVSVLSKRSIDDPTKWYKHVSAVQQLINSSYQRSVDTTPFQMLIATKMRTKEDLNLKELLDQELIAIYDRQRETIRNSAKQQILAVQEENTRVFNRKRKPARQYNENDVVAIKRTQLGGGLKLKPKYLGPYKIVKVKSNNTYDVIKIGSNEGPKHTTTCAEFMKPWPDDLSDDDMQDCRMAEM